MDVIEVEGNVSIEFFGAEDNDRDGITAIESMKNWTVRMTIEDEEIETKRRVLT